MFSHGGNIYEIERLYKTSKDEILDYSSNINPLGVNSFVLEALKNNFNSIQRYPDPGYFELKKAISNYYQIDFNHIFTGNGATELIFLIAQSLKPKKALIISPTFLEYEKALLNVDCKIKHFRLDEKNEFIINKELLKKEIKNKYDIVFLCNPNNPTSVYTELNDLEEIAAECKKTNTTIVLDESFIDFISESDKKSSLNIVSKYDNIIVIKSLTKFFAIPGLRLGFGITSNQNFYKKITGAQSPWSVNCFSEIAGINLFKDIHYISRTISSTQDEIDFLSKELSKMEKIKIFKPTVNFILIKLLNNLTSDKLKNNLIHDKILIRDASNFNFLNEKFVRVAVKKRDDNLILLEKLKLRLGNE